MIHLDTGFLIHAIVAGTNADRLLRRWLAAGTPVAMSTIAWAEFLCGPLAAAQRTLALHVVTVREPFLYEDAQVAAAAFNRSGRRRGTFIDCMIAASAMRVGARLATTNPADFQRLDPRLDLVSA